MRLTACTYCGDLATERDHVIPVCSMAPRKGRYRATDWIVPSCHECNVVLNGEALFNVPSRAAYLIKRYESRWAKVLRVPVWSDDEIADLRGNLKRRVRAIEDERAQAVRRLAFLALVASQDDAYMR